MNFPPSLFSGGGLSLVRILGSASRAIGIFRQISPLISEMKPLISTVPKLAEKLNNIRNNVSVLTTVGRNNSFSYPSTNQLTPKETGENKGPVFFQ